MDSWQIALFGAFKYIRAPQLKLKTSSTIQLSCACSKPQRKALRLGVLVFAPCVTVHSPSTQYAHLPPHTVGRRPRLSLAIASFCSSLRSQPTSLWLGLTAARKPAKPYTALSNRLTAIVAHACLAFRQTGQE